MKFVNIKTEGYDSKFEAERARELNLLQKSGLISNLREKETFILQDGFTYVGYDRKLHKCRPITYTPDFIYNEGSKIIVEDTKGIETEVFKLKRKLFMFRYPEYVFFVNFQEKRSPRRKYKRT